MALPPPRTDQQNSIPSDPPASPLGSANQAGEPAVAPPRPGNNPFAVAAFLLSVCGSAVGLTLAIVALVQIRRSGQRGRGLAITALVISSAVTLFWLGFVGHAVYSALDSRITRDGHGHIAAPVDVSPLVLEPGDCIERFTQPYRGLAVTAVPCPSLHTGEVVALLPWLAGEDTDATVNRCQAQFNKVLSFEMAHEYLAGIVTPSADARRQGSDQVVCVLYGSEERRGSVFA